MKGIIAILVFFIILSFSILSSAQQTAEPPHKVTPAPAKTKTLTGRIDSVTSADPEKGIRSEIGLVDKNGKKSIFLVKSVTTIYDINWKPITLDKITKKQMVRVKYTTTKEGVNEAISIKVAK